MLVWAVVMIRSLRESAPPPEEQVEQMNPDVNGAPRFTLDYSGRLWIDRRRKGFFRRIRRRQPLPPHEPEE
jgi:hypothetical protein